jgi:hypothetical protein
MHVRKATEELRKLTSAPASIGTFIRATVLLDALEKDNENVDTGERRNETARDKIRSARNWFEILCGIGEDGNWPEDSLRRSIGQDLYMIQSEINNEDSPCSHFKRWRAVESTD